MIYASYMNWKLSLNVKVGFRYLSGFTHRDFEAASGSPGIKRGGEACTLIPGREDLNYQQVSFFGSAILQPQFIHHRLP